MIKKSDLIQMRIKLSKLLFSFSELISTEGVAIIYDGETPTEGMEVFTYDVEGSKVMLPDGSYKVADEAGEMTIVVLEGKVSSVEVAPVEGEAPTEEALADDAPVDDSKVDDLGNKLNELFDIVNKINEAVLSFGSQEDDVLNKEIDIKDKSNAGGNSAEKYFSK